MSISFHFLIPLLFGKVRVISKCVLILMLIRLAVPFLYVRGISKLALILLLIPLSLSLSLSLFRAGLGWAGLGWARLG